ncbi:hypothetical protein Tco_0902807 [Tanacetum coccineum]
MTMSIPSQDEQLTNRPLDFAKPVKAITLPQDVPSTSDRRLIELENQVQRLMEAHLALTQPTQVNKITTSCEIYSDPHDTQYCIEDPEQAFVEYASSCYHDMGNRKLTSDQGPMSFNKATNTWKDKPNFNWEQTQTFTSPRNGSISTHSSNYQMKLEKALDDFDSYQEKRLSHLKTQLEQQQDDMIRKINLLHIEREEIRRKGIKIPSKLFSLKYLSPSFIIELNKNPSALKRVYFVNSIVILSEENEAKEGETMKDITPEHGYNITKKAKGEVKEVMKEDKCEVETD